MPCSLPPPPPPSHSSSSGFPSPDEGYYALEVMEKVRVHLDPENGMTVILLSKEGVADGTTQESPMPCVCLGERTLAVFIHSLQHQLKLLRELPPESEMH